MLALVLPSNPARPILPSEETLYGSTTLPTSNVFVPAIEIEREICELPLSERSTSAIRPPQPVRPGRSGTEVCHWTDWSACEKSCGGTATPPERYCARV